VPKRIIVMSDNVFDLNIRMDNLYVSKSVIIKKTMPVIKTNLIGSKLNFNGRAIIIVQRKFV
jgi:hypothetical protein